MALPEKFFFGSCFFLIGVFFASASFGLATIFLTCISALLCLVFFFGFRKKSYLSLFFLLFLIPIGSLYYTTRDTFIERIPAHSTIDARAEVIKDVRVLEYSQEAIVSIYGENEKTIGRALLRLKKFPEIHYGDVIRLRGNAELPEGAGYAGYLEKSGISAIVAFPEIVFLGENRGSLIMKMLFSVKRFSLDALANTLPPKESAFLSGVVLGDKSGFSKEFKEAMSQSGTSHLVALSGYNIMILIKAIMGVCVGFFSRKTARWIAGASIFAFVAMTGAEASVVRAAIMGCILLFVGGRKNADPRNLLIFAALAMVLWNPKVLVFDVGFQLSFFALLGIVYVSPALISLFHIKNSHNFLSLKESFISTAGAQIAVLPILLNSFGSISWTALLANTFILGFIPITMCLGFLIICAAILFFPISVAIGWIAWIFVKFEIGIIEFFAGISDPLSFSVGVGTIILYYVVLGIFVWHMMKKESIYHKRA